MTSITSSTHKKNLFIDAGGHDGCPLIKFLFANPEYNCMSFETNPIFAHYYWCLPGELNQSAAYMNGGMVDFIIDPVDGDGSSLIGQASVQQSLPPSKQPTIRPSLPAANKATSEPTTLPTTTLPFFEILTSGESAGETISTAPPTVSAQPFHLLNLQEITQPANASCYIFVFAQIAWRCLIFI